jgi:hypothetical protein
MMTLWLVNFFAIGFLVFLATVVLRFAMRGAITRKHVWEAVRVISVMAAVALVIPATRGEIGHWGIWLGLGLGMVMASALTALLV